MAISHLVGVYWGLRGFVALATFSPVQTGNAPAIYGWINYRWFELGPFGVAVFFLISGLVIPFSLEKHTRLTFIGARLLRIYPTFIVAILFEMALLHVASWYWHKVFLYSPMTIATNCLLVNDLLGYPVIDFVNWTLAIEIKFYVLVALVANSVRAGRVGTLFTVAAGMMGVDLCIARLSPDFRNLPIVSSFSLETPYLMFMLIGILFNFHYRRHIGTAKFSICVIAMTIVFLCCWRLGPQRGAYPVVTLNYVMALLLFVGLYNARHYIRDNRILNFAASISFPFYLLHAVVGFTIIKYVMLGLGLDYYIGVTIAVVAITLMATLLHGTIENLTIRLGHRLGNSKPARIC